MADFRNINPNINPYMNVSLNNLFRMATKTQQIFARFATSLFTAEDYQSLSNPFDADSDVSLSTLRKYNLIIVVDVHVSKFYVKRDRWGDYDIIPMTDEQYEMLPNYFKDDVEIRTRKKYYYRVNLNEIGRLLVLAHAINSIEINKD